MDKQEHLIEHVKNYLEDDFFIKITEDNEIIEINDSEGDAYIDWYYKEFDQKELKKFANHCYNAKDNDFKELGSRILLALKNYNEPIIIEKMKKVVCCGKILKTPFCPDCGKSLTEAENTGNSLFPHKFYTYLHGDRNNESKRKIINNIGLSIHDNHPVIGAIIGCDHEIKIDWILFEDGNIIIEKVNGLIVQQYPINGEVLRNCVDGIQ